MGFFGHKFIRFKLESFIIERGKKRKKMKKNKKKRKQKKKSYKKLEREKKTFKTPHHCKQSLVTAIKDHLTPPLLFEIIIEVSHILSSLFFIP
jgi:hypothetical protein